MVNGGASVATAVLAFLAVFVGWCVLLLLTASIARNWSRATGALAPSESHRSV